MFWERDMNMIPTNHAPLGWDEHIKAMYIDEELLYILFN